MARNNDDPEMDLWNDIASVFVGNKTTIAERAWIAYQWTQGDHETYVRVAAEKGITPIVLLAASLIDTEHPILVPNGGLCVKNLIGFVTLLLAIEYRQALTGNVISDDELYDVVNSFHRSTPKPVDKYKISVDKPVGNCVDKLVSPVDNYVD